MGLFLDTTVTVAIAELGITLTHPTINFEISAQFTSDEISRAESLTTAIQAGTLIWKKTSGGAAETPADYDPDYLEVEEHATGQEDLTSQVVKRQGYRTSIETQTAVNAFTYQITKSDHHIHRLSGAGPFATQPVYTLPDATTLEAGHQYLIINDSTASVSVKNGAGIEINSLLQTKRLFLFLADNTTVAGVWDIITAGSSAVQGVAPVLASYNGNANANRFLEVFPSLDTNVAPFLIPSNAIVVAVTASANSIVTDGQIGIYEIGDLITPRYTIQFTNTDEVIELLLNVPFSAGEKMAFKVQPGSDSFSKPRIAVYIAGA